MTKRMKWWYYISNQKIEIVIALRNRPYFSKLFVIKRDEGGNDDVTNSQN